MDELGSAVRGSISKAADHLRAALHTALVLGIIVSLTLSVPLWFARSRHLIAGIDPDLLPRWREVAWDSWTLTGLVALPIILWRTRQVWIALVTWALHGLLTQAGRFASWAWRRLWHRESAPDPAEKPPAAPPIPVVETAQLTCALPPLDLLGPLMQVELKPCPEDAQTVVGALASLGAPGAKVVSAMAGPAIKTVQIRTDRPASFVSKLSSDLAAALGVKAVSINPVVGAPGVLQIELALSTDRAVAVPLRTLVESRQFRDGGELPVAVGIDVRGEALVIDLTSCPHLLIAGATKSGKSGTIRGLITCLIIRHSPSELRLLLIDPKRVEFTFWNGLPHLVGPIINTAPEAQRALQGLVSEMHRRYELLQQAGVTNIQGFNQKNPKRRLPYIVCVIDEFGQLMEEDKEIKESTESAIKQLGQLARAAGIHLVLATQTPRATVISGTIKANIPAQIGLKTASSLESRIILDEVGCEKLRGKGDLLCRGGESDQLIRAQASWVPDEIVSAVVDWWKRPGQVKAATPDHVPDSVPSPAPPSPLPQPVPIAPSSPAQPQQQRSGLPYENDPELLRAKELALEHGAVSRRMVSRALGISSDRALELLNMMERRGWLRPAAGPKPRQVTFDPTTRRHMLAAMRGVAPEDVALLDGLVEADEPPPDTTPAAAPVRQAPANLLLEAQRLDAAAQQAVKDQDWEEAGTILQELNRLIDLSLEREDPEAFHPAAATRRWLKETLQNR